jgi:hypothetical protein
MGASRFDERANMDRTDDPTMSDAGELIAGYLAMAGDAAQEREAEEWAEALIDDAYQED